MNLHAVFEAERLLEIARRMNTGPAQARLRLPHGYGKTQRTVKPVLRRFHEAKEIRVMHDARHVRVGKFHHPFRFELVSHDGMLNSPLGIGDGKMAGLAVGTFCPLNTLNDAKELDAEDKFRSGLL